MRGNVVAGLGVKLSATECLTFSLGFVMLVCTTFPIPVLAEFALRLVVFGSILYTFFLFVTCGFFFRRTDGQHTGLCRQPVIILRFCCEGRSYSQICYKYLQLTFMLCAAVTEHDVQSWAEGFIRRRPTSALILWAK